jgi:putative transposase
MIRAIGWLLSGATFGPRTESCISDGRQLRFKVFTVGHVADWHVTYQPEGQPLKTYDITMLESSIREVQIGKYGGHDTHQPLRESMVFSCMARLARIVVPQQPHHVTQRGNRREAIFFKEGDHDVYRALLAEQARRSEVEVWAYCLMPNHVHLILVPKRADGLGIAVGEAHRRYTNFINARAGWTGHLFQRRFASVVMDDSHLRAAICYVSLNPVRAGSVAQAEDWPWSSVRAHLTGLDDALATVRPVLERVPDLSELLKNGCDEAFAVLRQAERTGRPAGAEDFVIALEQRLGRPISRRSPGRKPTPVILEQQLNLLQ